MSAHTYRYYARLTPGDQIPSVWCGDTDGPNVYEVRRHRAMSFARVHAWWRNLRRPAPRPRRHGTQDGATAPTTEEGQS